MSLKYAFIVKLCILLVIKLHRGHVVFYIEYACLKVKDCVHFWYKHDLLTPSCDLTTFDLRSRNIFLILREM